MVKRSDRQLKPEDLVSETGKAIPPSGIRKFFDIVYSMPDCISLGVGEPDFTTPWRISDSGIYALKDGYTHYTSNRGLLELRELIAEYIKHHYRSSYDPENEIIITLGVSQGLDIALRSLINPGDEIIIIEPCYVSYSANISVLHGRPVVVPTYFDNRFKIDMEILQKAVSPRTKAILLNYPSNPTGSTIDRKTLEEIAALAKKNNLIIITDEIYSAITYGHEHVSISSFPGMKERTILLNGFSKSHAMTGWRLGYICGPSYLVNIMLKIHQYTALCAPSMAQYAAIEAIRNGDKEIKKMNREYLKRCNFITNRFNEIGLPCLKPEGAFYVFPRISGTGLSSNDFAIRLIEEQKVAVVPGIAFGESGEGHIRCSYATSMENIRESMDRIEKFLKTL